MKSEPHETGEVLKFGDGVVGAKLFQELRNDCMKLIERTADYLDTIGRAESKRLEESIARAYATESLELTKLLMQLAILLLAWRNQKAGQVTFQEFEELRDEARPPVHLIDRPIPDELPEKFKALIVESRSILRRVQHVDLSLFQSTATE